MKAAIIAFAVASMFTINAFAGGLTCSSDKLCADGEMCTGDGWCVPNSLSKRPVKEKLKIGQDVKMKPTTTETKQR